MSQSFTKEERKRYQAYLKINLNDEQLTLPPAEQIAVIEKKDRRQWWMLGFNVIIIVFFSYSFLDDITQLSNLLFYILLAVFVINLGVIFYQKKKFNEVIAYLRWKKESSR